MATDSFLYIACKFPGRDSGGGGMHPDPLAHQSPLPHNSSHPPPGSAPTMANHKPSHTQVPVGNKMPQKES